jgi:hypothetical protein
VDDVKKICQEPTALGNPRLHHSTIRTHLLDSISHPGKRYADPAVAIPGKVVAGRVLGWEGDSRHMSSRNR